MARTIDLGEMNLTQMRGYRWEVSAGVDSEGNKHAVITEIYVVTDDNYTAVPEGLQRRAVEIIPGQQIILDNIFKDERIAAANRENVEAHSDSSID